MINTQAQRNLVLEHSRLISQSVKKAVDTIGVDSRLLSSRTRARKVSYCRMIYCNIMYQCTGLSYNDIGATIKITRAAVRKAVFAVADLYQKYEDFRLLADSIVENSESPVALFLRN